MLDTTPGSPENRAVLLKFVHSQQSSAVSGENPWQSASPLVFSGGF
jgi:hypothetical protein